MRRLSTGLVLTTILAAGCGDDDSSPNLVPAHTADFKPGSCPVAPPAGETVQCGSVIVPARRDGSAGDRKLTLPVAIIKSHAAKPTADPIVYLSGGPGQGAIGSVLPDPGPFAALLASRDLVLFDQRGTGFSKPSMSCGNSETVEACRALVTNGGAVPSDYTTGENANDVKDVRTALGYQHWVVFGISYGTRLALETMTVDAEGSSSVIIDSVLPPQVDWYAQEGPNAQRAFDLLFDGCAAQASCAAAYPDLRAAFYTTATSLNATPVTLTLSDGSSAKLSGSLLTQLVFMVMYSAEVLPELPRVIWEVHTSDYTTITRLLSAVAEGSSDVSMGMYLSVRCSEDIAFTTPEAVSAAAATMTDDLLRQEFATNELFQECATWDVPKAEAAARTPVTSALPTLVLEGSNDPVTPPAWGQLAASSLSNSFYFELPGQAHGVFSSPCGTALLATFLSDPTTKPASSCLSSVGPVAFSTPNDTQQSLPARNAAAAQRAVIDDEAARRIVDQARRSGDGSAVVERLAHRLRGR